MKILSRGKSNYKVVCDNRKCNGVGVLLSFRIHLQNTYRKINNFFLSINVSFVVQKLKEKTHKS